MTTVRASKAKIQAPKYPTWENERACHAQGYALVAGCDEVGRGAWAGPLVAAAVIFPPELVQADEADDGASPLAGVRDSKQLTPRQREALVGVIRQHALAVGVGLVSAPLGDLIGWGAANRLALVRAIRALPVRPEYVLLDAFGVPGLALPQLPLIKGDARCLSIAAASIIAKTVRDGLLVAAAAHYPAYDFAVHKGYGTAAHAAALAAHGPSPYHRHSFAPVRDWRLQIADGGVDDAESDGSENEGGSDEFVNPPAAIPTPQSAHG